MKPYRFIISGGGTGGHMYPALAIAHAIRLEWPEAKILFVGALGKIEMDKVPAHGFPIKGLWIAGFQRGQLRRNILFGVKLLWSLLHSLFILLGHRPHMAIGTGGFASGPLLFMAQLFGVKTLVQEQNSYPGVTNRFLGKKANIVSVAYSRMDRFFASEKVKFTGNPIRKSVLHLPKPNAALKQKLGLDPDRPVLLMLGGSLGARTLNELMASHHESFLACGYQIIWQCGQLYRDTYFPMQKEGLKIVDFISQMDEVYAVSDVIISRAGAGTLSELSCVGKPAILIPSINVAENHQYKNALAFEEHQAAVLIQESEADEVFESQVCQLLNDAQRQLHMGQNMKSLAKPEATETIVEYIKELLP